MTTSCVRDRLSASELSTATAMQMSLRRTSEKVSWSYGQSVLITENLTIAVGLTSTLKWDQANPKSISISSLADMEQSQRGVEGL